MKRDVNVVLQRQEVPGLMNAADCLEGHINIFKSKLLQAGNNASSMTRL